MLQEIVKFHVMVPVYKAEQYLNECVGSVMNQTYQNFDLILVDDGSPDRSGEMCDVWAKKDSRIRVYHKPNGGALHSRCFAIQKVLEGGITEIDYAVFLDSDDLLEPHALATIAATLKGYDCDCVIYGMETFGEGVTPRRGKTVADRPVLVKDKRELYDITLKDDGDYNPLWRKAVSMKLFSCNMEKYTPYYRVSIAEDRLQSLEIYQKCQSVCFIPDILLRYRMNLDSITHKTRYQEYCIDYTVYEVEKDMLEQEPAYTGEPFAAYRSYHIYLLTGTLVRIARFPLSRKERIDYYRRLKASRYWREFLSGGSYDKRTLGKMTIIYEAFRRNWYDLIFMISSVYGIIKR